MNTENTIQTPTATTPPARIEMLAICVAAVFSLMLYGGVLHSLPIDQQLPWAIKGGVAMWLMVSGVANGYIASSNGMARIHVVFALLKTLVACALFIYGTLVLLQA